MSKGFEDCNFVSLNYPATAGNAVAVVTIPAGYRYRFISFFARLITNATAGNRYFQLQVKDAAGNIIFAEQCASAHPASVDDLYDFGEGVNFGYVMPSTMLMMVPVDFVLGPGFTLEFSVQGGLAGDSHRGWYSLFVAIQD